jgi:hypothetical protein
LFDTGPAAEALQQLFCGDSDSLGDDLNPEQIGFG